MWGVFLQRVDAGHFSKADSFLTILQLCPFYIFRSKVILFLHTQTSLHMSSIVYCLHMSPYTVLKALVWCYCGQSAVDEDINIEISSASLQPFTDEQWRTNQLYMINTVNTQHSFYIIAAKTKILKLRFL